MQEILKESAGDTITDIRVDRVYRENRFLGFMAVLGIPHLTDANSALALAGMEAEIQKNPDATYRRTTFNGRTALVVELDGAGLAFWSEASYVKMVFATDIDDAVPIAEAAAQPR